jgi:hypothetical protein
VTQIAARDGVDREAYITEILFPEVGPGMFNAPCRSVKQITSKLEAGPSFMPVDTGKTKRSEDKAWSGSFIRDQP